VLADGRVVDAHELLLDIDDVSARPVHCLQDLVVLAVPAQELVRDDLAQVVEQPCHEGVLGGGGQHLGGHGLGAYGACDAVLPEGVEVERPAFLFVEEVDHADAESRCS
jgi:hypothetical protein